MTINNDDLNRSLGRVEGEILAMKDRIDRIEEAISAGFKELAKELADLKAREQKRSGIETAALWIAGAIGGLVAFIATHLFK